MKNEITTSADQEQVMILDCTAYPRQSLIQNDEGTRAMCTALKDILWFSDFVFPATGAHDKPVKMAVTNVDPDQGGRAASCRFSVEVKYRGYSREDILKVVRKHIFSKFVARSDGRDEERAA